MREFQHPLVMFACNDPRNGNDTGHVGAIEVRVGGARVLALDGPVGDDDEDLTPLDIGRDTITIDGAKYAHKGARSWVGNWCWDAAYMEVGTLVEMLNRLLRSGDWQCNEGGSGLFDKWRRGAELTVEDLVGVGERTEGT